MTELVQCLHAAWMMQLHLKAVLLVIPTAVVAIVNTGA